MSAGLQSRARQRLVRERGTIQVKQAGLRVALVFPNTYRLGMASLGFHLVHQMLNELPNVSCERAFLPDPDELAEYERTRTEMFSLETQTPLSRFDVVAFSVSFEMDYLNVLRILRLANIPLESADRESHHPTVVAGGICPTFNPEPLSGFIDAFVIGDAEPVLPGLALALSSESGDRLEILRGLTGLRGVYVPAVHGSSEVERAVEANLGRFCLRSVIQTPDSEFGEIELVEVARGCGRGCRFCVAGHVTRPPRVNKKVDLADSPRYGLVGAAVFDCPQSLDLCKRIVRLGGQFTVSSLRLETVTLEVAELLAAGGQKTLTIAPEAGNDRLRTVLNKSVDEATIMQVVSNVRKAGIRRIKLYFMVGLPTETDQDAHDIADLVSRTAQVFSDVRLQVSVSCFVPKPWTPFQWHPMECESVLKRRLAIVRKELSLVPRVRFGGESARLALIQGLLARGDREIGKLLVRALDNGGGYRSVIQATAAYFDRYVHRQRDRDEAFPWDHVRALSDKTALWNEYQRALEGG